MTESTTDDCSHTDMISWVEILSEPREQFSPSALSPRHLQSILRSVLDIPHSSRAPLVPAPSIEPEGQYIDPEAWLLWAEMGLYLFAVTREEETAEPPDHSPRDASTQAPASKPYVSAIPSIRQMMRAAQRVAVMLAMVRHKDNLTQAAATLGLSRRSLRDLLRQIRVYPWSDFVAGKLQHTASAKTPAPDSNGSVPNDEG